MSGDIPRTPNQDRGESSRKSNRRPDILSGDFSLLKKQQLGDQNERNRPSQLIRICNLLLGPKEYGYASRVLTPAEADPTNPMLRISNDYEHFVFLNNHSFVDNPGITGSIPYRVYGEYSRQYNMMLSRTQLFRSMLVSLSGWKTLVRDCGLKAGDDVWFCRYLDTTISDDFVYFLNSITNQLLEAPEVSGLSTSKPVIRIIYRRLPLVKIPGQGPGSRDLPQEAHCISRTLTQYNVASDIGKVFLSATDAVILTGNPRILQLPDGKYEKDIQVFDVENREYTMTVSAHYSRDRGVFYYYLSGEWTNFVKRHNLEEGDLLMIYKCLDSTISSRYYHVFRYVSKKAVDVVPFKNDSGETQKGNVPKGLDSRCLS